MTTVESLFLTNIVMSLLFLSALEALKVLPLACETFDIIVHVIFLNSSWIFSLPLSEATDASSFITNSFFWPVFVDEAVV